MQSTYQMFVLFVRELEYGLSPYLALENVFAVAD